MSLDKQNTSPDMNIIQSGETFDKMNSRQLLGEAADSFVRSFQANNMSDKYQPSTTSYNSNLKTPSDPQSSNSPKNEIISGDFPNSKIQRIQNILNILFQIIFFQEIMNYC